MSRSSSPQPVAPTTIELARRGDVLLRLGGGSQDETRLLVSAVTMSEASSVFAAMFNGHFLEGQTLSPDAPREVALPDDDPESMKILCKIVHFKADDVFETLTLDRLADFAILCDKYDCTEAVAPWSRLWINEFLALPVTLDTEKLVFIAYLLDLPRQFRQVTKILIQHRTASIHVGIASYGTDVVPEKFLVDMKKMWNKLLDQSVAALHPRDLYDTLTAAQRCTSTIMFTQAWFAGLARANLLMFWSISLQELSTRVQKFAAETLPSISCQHRFCKGRLGSFSLQINAVYSVTRNFAFVEGFCLDCVKKEATGDRDRACREAHNYLW